MGLGISTKKQISSVPVWQRNGAGPQVFQGGFALITAGLLAGSYLPAGTPLVCDEVARTATPLVSGSVYTAAAADALEYQVAKGHNFKVGQNFAAKTGGKAYPITGIDTSNEAYDVITIGTTIGAVAQGAFVFASSTTGATNSSFGGVNGLLYEAAIVQDGESCSAVYRGTVYAKRVPYSPDLEAALPHIVYSKSL